MRTKVVLLVVASLCVPMPVLADTPPAGEKSLRATAARDGGEAGLRHFAAGRLIEAYASFQRADALFHAPTLVLYMAHCRKRLGKLASARALYRQVADERIPSTAPLQFQTAQAVAREELEHLERRVPVVELKLTGGSLPAARVTVDGTPAAALASQRLLLDPGEHVIEARVGDGEPIRRPVSLREGMTIRLSLTLPAAPPSALSSSPNSDAAPAKDANAGPRGSLAPALITFGVAAAAIGVGATTGALSLGQVGELRARCGPDRGCPASAQPRAASAGRLADASTIAFIAGGVALTAGVVLLVLRPGPRVELGLGLGPRAAFITGRF